MANIFPNSKQTSVLNIIENENQVNKFACETSMKRRVETLCLSGSFDFYNFFSTVLKLTALLYFATHILSTNNGHVEIFL